MSALRSTKYNCNGCGSTNLRFRANGTNYQCYACGYAGDKMREIAEAQLALAGDKQHETPAD